MKATYTPEGGKFGHGFDYHCKACGAYLGNSVTNEELKHPTHVSGGWFRKDVPSACVHAGEVHALPEHEVDLQ